MQPDVMYSCITKCDVDKCDVASLWFPDGSCQLQYSCCPDPLSSLPTAIN